MPIISWTAGEILQSKPIEAGVYPGELMKYDGPKRSQSGKGINLFLTFRITDGPAVNKELTVACSSGVRSASMLGDLYFVPMSTVAYFAAAVNGKPAPDESDGQAEIDELMHKPLNLIVGVSTVEGKILNPILGYQPFGTSQQPPF